MAMAQATHSTRAAAPAAAPLAATQQDGTYLRIRQWIGLGRFLPGERLKIRQVAAELGVGQMPVRAALQRLAAEGALVNRANCGVAVPRLSRAEFDDVLQVRLLLEGDAAERGALRLDDPQRARLAALCGQMRAAVDGADVKAYLDANEDFHRLLYGAAGSPTLMALIETVWLKVGPISNQLFDEPAAVPRLNDAHEDVVAALRRRDGAAVRQAIERDLFVAGQSLRRRCGVG
jgi:DNA-binding GntR family transcriptional regulator